MGEILLLFHLKDVYKRQDTINVKRPSEIKKHKSLHGLTRTLLNNMIVGTNEG